MEIAILVEWGVRHYQMHRFAIHSAEKFKIIAVKKDRFLKFTSAIAYPILSSSDTKLTLGAISPKCLQGNY